MEPNTRRWIVIMLAVIAIVCIVGEVILRLDGQPVSAELLTLAATALGGLAGLAVPHVQQAEAAAPAPAPEAEQATTLAPPQR